MNGWYVVAILAGLALGAMLAVAFLQWALPKWEVRNIEYIPEDWA